MGSDSRWRWLLAVVPGFFAWLAFRPRDRFVRPSAVLGVAGWTRTIIGFVIVIGVGVAIQDKDQPELTNDAVVKAEIAAGLAVPSILLLMGLLIRLTPEPGRAAAKRAMLRPLAALGAFIALAVVFFGRLSIAPLWGTPLDQLGWGRGGPLAGLALYLSGWWVLVNFVLGIFLVGRHWFNAVDGHPLLAPLIGAWMAWLTAGTGLLIDGADGLSGRTLLLVNLGGPVTVTLLSLAETFWLRRRGITLRSGPGGHEPRPPREVGQQVLPNQLQL
jgi:hypothetical protein